METVQIWNVSAGALLLDISRRAVPPGASTRVAAAIAAELVAGPDWSLENPRHPHERKTHRKPARAEPEAQADQAEADEKE